MHACLCTQSSLCASVDSRNTHSEDSMSRLTHALVLVRPPGAPQVARAWPVLLCLPFAASVYWNGRPPPCLLGAAMCMARQDHAVQSAFKQPAWCAQRHVLSGPLCSLSPPAQALSTAPPLVPSYTHNGLQHAHTMNCSMQHSTPLWCRQGYTHNELLFR